MSRLSPDTQQRRQASWAAGLNLLNLLLLPGVAFIVLLIWWKRIRRNPPSHTTHHVSQSLLAAAVSGIALLVITAIFFMLGGVNQPLTWVVVILYFVSIHATLVLLGVVSLVHAHNGKPFTYPLFGRLAQSNRNG